MQCSFCERTDEECRIRKAGDNYYCPKHISRYYRNQSMKQKTIYDPNEYVLYDDKAEIILCNKTGNEIARAIIDKECVEKCKHYKWHLRKGHGDTDYVIASLANNQKIHLHRCILDYDGEKDVDHINRNGLDNRQANLRIVDHSRNTLNNKHTGIYRLASGRFRASCCKCYKTYYIGTFDTFEQAQNARNEFMSKRGWL